MTATPSLLRLRAIGRSYQDGTKAISDLSLDIVRGEFVAIVGRSGAGKSTLVNVIGLLDLPTEGSYEILGQDVRALTEQARNALRSQTFGFVFQSSHMVAYDSAARNAALGLIVRGVRPGVTTPAVVRALETVGLSHRRSVPARNLSGGERQRLAVARATITEPDIILADEPTGNLDSLNGDAVFNLLLERHRAGATVILITHDEALAGRADRIVRLSDGRLLEDVRLKSTSTRNSHYQAAHKHITRIGRTRNALLEALNSLSLRPWRSVALASAYLLGVAGLVASVGTASTAANQIADRLSAAGLDELSAYAEPNQPLAAIAEDAQRISELQHVVEVGSIRSLDSNQARVSLFPNDSVEGQPAFTGQAVAVDDGYLHLEGVRTRPETAGILLAYGESSSVALIGRNAAKELGVAAAGSGSALWIGGVEYSVIGIVDAAPRNPALLNAIMIPAAAAPSATVEFVIRTDVGYPSVVADAVPYVLAPAEPGSVQVSTVADLRNLWMGVASDLGVLLAGLSAIILLMAVLSAGTTLFLSVQARTSEIALRRALGSSKSDVRLLFLLEGCFLGLAGGAAGAGVGLLTVVVLAAVRNWTPVVDANLIPTALLAGAVAGVVAGVVPAIRASTIPPAEAIR